MVTKLIKTDEEYQAALNRIDELFDARSGTDDGDTLDLLVHLVEVYEAERYPIDPPDPISAIEFRMDQQGLTERDLIPFVGNRTKVSEVLSGKRPITMRAARALHQHLGISAEVLLQEPREYLRDQDAGITLEHLPLAHR